MGLLIVPNKLIKNYCNTYPNYLLFLSPPLKHSAPTPNTIAHPHDNTLHACINSFDVTIFVHCFNSSPSGDNGNVKNTTTNNVREMPQKTV